MAEGTRPAEPATNDLGDEAPEGRLAGFASDMPSNRAWKLRNFDPEPRDIASFAGNRAGMPGRPGKSTMNRLGGESSLAEARLSRWRKKTQFS